MGINKKDYCDTEMKFWHNNLFCLQIREYTTMHALVMEYIEGPAILLVTYKGSIGDSRHDALNRKSRVKNKYNNCLVTCK